jgi:MFS family permease
MTPSEPTPPNRVGRINPETGPSIPNQASAPEAPDLRLPDFSLSRRRVIYVGIVAFIAWTFAVYDLITFGNLLPAIQQSFGWSTSTASYVATFVSLGSLVVAVAVGPIIDLLGRKPALLVTTAGAAVSSGLAALAFGPVSLVLFRTLSGFGMSEQAVNSAYLNEVFPARRKGFFYGLVQGGWPVGVMLSAAIAATLEPSIGWRGVFLVATFPLVVILILVLWLKESPYFRKLQYIRQRNAAGDTRSAEAAAQHWGLESSHIQRKNTYAELFAPQLRRQTISVGTMFFLKLIGDSQMTILATTVLVHGKGIDLTGALWTVFIANAVAFVGYLVFGYLGDRIGRRETVIGCEVLAALTVVYLLLAANSFAAIVLSYSLVLFFAQGAAAPLFAYVGESYPTRVRGTGAAFINITGPIGGIVGPLLYAALLTAGLSAATAGLSGAIAAILAGACLLGARRIPPQQDLADVAERS